MKKVLALLTGTAVVLAFGLAYGAYADDNTAAPNDTGDRMIRNEDLLRNDFDQDRATVNQMPEGSGAEGSGAGGVVKDQDSWKNDSAPDQPSVDKPAPGTDSKETDGKDAGKDKKMGDYHYGY